MDDELKRDLLKFLEQVNVEFVSLKYQMHTNSAADYYLRMAQEAHHLIMRIENL